MHKISNVFLPNVANTSFFVARNPETMNTNKEPPIAQTISNG